MVYNEELKNVMLDVLENRTLSITNSIQTLLEAGYIPNKNKFTILDWSTILFHAYENIDVLTKEQQEKINRLCNLILTM